VRTFGLLAIVGQKLSKYLKLIKLAIIMVLSNVKDERTFFIVNFMKFKFYKCLTIHLDLVVKMYA
jgi:hypothetical protein